MTREDFEIGDGKPEIAAAGGVLISRSDDGPRIAVIHRPKYMDWSLPKGKLEEGEGWQEAALREVEEEVGLRCRLGEELPHAAYTDHKGRAKVVRYWLMEPEDDAAFEANEEVDEMRWLARDAAATVLSYPHDAELVRAALDRLA